MDAAAPIRPITVPTFQAARQEGRKLAVLTAYDFPMAALLDAAGVDALLVGDTLGMVVQGKANTLPVTLDEMIYHASMVTRAAKRALVIGDLPLGSYQVSCEQGVASSIRLVKEAGVHAVKLEGGKTFAPLIEKIVAAGIPVMAHCGMLPQHVNARGGFKLERNIQLVLEDCQAVVAAGAFSVVLECVPDELARQVTESLQVPTIGIGAGPHCTGQVLVTHDLLGLTQGLQPKFVKRYANLNEVIGQATRSYIEDVRSGAFPTARPK